MNKLSVIVLACIVLVTQFTSCKRPPVAVIVLSEATIKVGKPFTLTSDSEFADRIEWDLGDGNKSTQRVFQYTYPTTGNFTIKLKAFNNNNKNEDEASRQVIVIP